MIVAEQFGVSKERLRQIEAKALRRLRYSARSKQFKPITIRELKENQFISDEERDVLVDLENDILNSNLIFKHDSVDDLDFDKGKFDAIRHIKEQINIRKEEARNQTKQKIAKKDITDDITIEELDFSVRSFCSLKRAGINTINELRALSEEEVMKIRYLGRRGVEEVVAKLEMHGLKLGELTEPLEAETQAEEIIDKKTFKIEELGLSARGFACLKRAGINTLADLENLSYEELLNIKKLGNKTALDIIAKVKKYGITFKSAEMIEGTEVQTENPANEKVYSESEMEETKAKRTELEAKLKALDEQTIKARELLAEYNKLIGDDKVNTDDKAPDFKDE